MTNFHTHGLHVSPSGNSDNVLALYEPNVQVDLAFDIPPDGTSGLYIPGFYWYHPHLHGTTSEQVNGGMAGALIVEGALDELPAIKGLTERLFILHASAFDDDGNANLGGDPTLFVNNQLQPTVPIAPGETQRWRILNASSGVFIDLALDDHLCTRSPRTPTRCARWGAVRRSCWRPANGSRSWCRAAPRAATPSAPCPGVRTWSSRPSPST